MSNDSVLNEIQKAIGAHGKWKFNLKLAITHGKSDFEVSKVMCDNLCEFGKWLHGPTIDEEIRAGKPYEVVTRLHAEFHKTAAHVLKLALHGRSEEADALLDGEFSERSAILVKALNKWKAELSTSTGAY